MKTNRCQFCKKEFIKNSGNQIHCSKSCKNKFYYQCNKQKINDRVKKRYELNKEEILKKDRNRYQLHGREQLRNKYKTNINFKVTKILRARIYDVLKGKNKSKHTLELLGCSLEFLKQYLERQFKLGMSWNNWGRGMGKWNIDHIIPCASFDLSKPEEQVHCFHYTNLQPLWSEENLKKSNKV